MDTHILIWWVHDELGKLSKAQGRVLSQIERNREPIGMSAITLWEVAMLMERGRLSSTTSLDHMLDQLESHPLLTVLPLTTRIAAESVRLGEGFHRDPADQIIVATARHHSLTLLTADERIRKWGKVNLV